MLACATTHNVQRLVAASQFAQVLDECSEVLQYFFFLLELGTSSSAMHCLTLLSNINSSSINASKYQAVSN